MNVLLIADRADLPRAIAPCLRPETRVEALPARGLVDGSSRLSAHGRRIVERATEDTVLLIEWAFDEAPALNALTHAIRERRAGPCIMLCGATEHPEALAAGADGVLAVPFDPGLLEAIAFAHRRLLQVTEAALRAELGAESAPRPVLDVAGIRLDRSSLTVTVGERSARVTPRESGLLAYLMQRAGQVCSREEILAQVWGIRFDTGTNMVDVYVYFVRRRLDALGHSGGITTVRGVGYRLELPD